MHDARSQAFQLSDYTMITSEAAHYLDVSVGHLYNLLSQGRGPSHVKYGGQLRFRPADLDRWVAGRCVIVPSGPAQP